MFERFTDRARRIVVLAQEEARKFGHNSVRTEHILLGIVDEGQGVASRALEDAGIGAERMRARLHEAMGVPSEAEPDPVAEAAAPEPEPGPRRTRSMPERIREARTRHIPFASESKRVLELSLREALEFGHNYIGTEHILLGLMVEGEGMAATVLRELGADVDAMRERVSELLRAHRTRTGTTARTAAAGPQLVHYRWQSEVLAALEAISDRLTAIERHLGLGQHEPAGGSAAGEAEPEPPTPADA
jgi:ATP-dependent Clp protease ATP-binding subunit ClpC